MSMKGISVRRLTGIATAASLALALLAAGSMLAAVAGPRQAQATATRTLEQTMGGVSPLDKTFVVSGNWNSISNILQVPTFDSGSNAAVPTFTPANLAEIIGTLRSDFGRAPLRMAPQPADWAGMTTALYPATSGLPFLGGIPTKLEVAYRYPLAGHVRLIAGSMPGTASGSALQVVVTAQTARTFGLRPGSKLGLSGSNLNTGQNRQASLDVTGIVAPSDPGSSFWQADPLLSGATLEYDPAAVWVGGVIADPGESTMIQSVFGVAGLTVQWDLPADTADQQGPAQALYNQVNQITSRTPELTGAFAPISDALTVTTGMQQPLAALVQSTGAVNVLLWMVYVGLAIAGAVMLLLAAWMIASRRYAELAIYKARGASQRQVFLAGFTGAAVAAVPACALAWAAAVLLVPDATPSGPAAWWPGILTLAIATAGPGIAAAWQHRLPRRRPVRRRRRQSRASSRVVFEVTACLAAVGGIIIARTQSSAGNLYSSAAPVLIAVPAVIIMLRLYKLVLRGLARASARQRGVIGFLGLARAAQVTFTLALPAMTLVLAVTVAAFTGMVKDAVAHGEVTASWQATGADVTVTAPFAPATLQSLISPSAVREITTAPGVQRAATALLVPLRTAGSQEVTAIAVDPASYAALTAATQGFSPVNPALLTEPDKDGAIPVLASPQAAADLGGTIYSQQGLPALRVRIAGELQSTPAMPGGGAFMVLPLSAIRSIGQPVNLVLLTGQSIDMTRVRAAAQDAAVITRSAALQELTGAPLQQGTFSLFTLAIGYAAALALAVILLQLTLGATDRQTAMARLATMGLGDRQRVLLAAFEVLPAVAASAVAAIACAVVLPRVVAPAIDLSVFTQSQAPVPLRPDAASFVLPLAGVFVAAVIALVYEIRSGRGSSVATTMRAS
jgi:putative ABC transport system permease protein